MQAIIKYISYTDKDNKSVIKIETDKGIFYDYNFKPYFYIKTNNPDKLKKALNLKLEKEKDYYKVIFDTTKELKEKREEIEEEKYEHDIPFAKRYMTDKKICVPCVCELETEGEKIEKIEFKEIGKPRVLAFDIETYMEKGGFSGKDGKVIMASFYGKKGEIYTTDKGIKNAKLFESEKELIKGIIERLQNAEEEIITTYNGDRFDIPFIEERAKIYNLKFDGLIKRKGMNANINLEGKQHIDAYKMLKFLSRFSIVSLVKFDLESVVKVLLEREKEKINYKDIKNAWKTRNKEKLNWVAEYCIEDSETTKLITEKYLGLLMELAEMVNREVFDISRASSSILIEALMLKESKKYGVLVPRLPNNEEFAKRYRQSVQGGYVKEPLPGIHENLAVLDFSSLYPTVIISHNISNETLDCGHPECKKNTAPTKHCFCTKKKGFFPLVIEELLRKRLEYKRQMKEKKGTKEYQQLYEKSWGYKIFLNSFYGYLGYARSRFYCRECAAAITAWSREYIQMVGKEAEKEGYIILYGDTDSEFLILPEGKTEKDVKEFVAKINKKLPGVMNLELEGMFKRGLFVTKESGETAKKRYALIDYKGNLKIVGLEYVRRDWAKIARITQQKVIEAVLKDGSAKKAIKIVRDCIDYLKTGKAKKEELVILTRLIKDVKHYNAKGPHLSAALKAIKRGKEMPAGSIVEYIITKNGKSISDKAEMEEYVKDGDYDIDYYIEHQVISAVYKIIRELGYSKDDLLQGGKQKNLFSY